MILQDLVNELGRRLDYDVISGRYQGTASAIGYDGIWLSPEGHAIVAEVKTTDAYRISLDTIAAYRSRLLEAQQITGTSSILIVVGRQDTGDLEAQVRGSRHAWDVRLISAEALLKLVGLRQSAEGPDTGRKIRNLLIPTEYTWLDGMIDVMFTAARDVEEGAVEAAADDRREEPRSEQAVQVASKAAWQFTDSNDLQQKREDIVGAVSRARRTELIKKTRALYSDRPGMLRLACTISKRYEGKANPYWYAYHPPWDEYLASAQTGLLVLGCMDLSIAFAIPREVLHPLLEALHVTVRPTGEQYWHIHLVERQGEFGLVLPKRSTELALKPYVVAL